MSIETFDNGETGAAIRAKLNEVIDAVNASGGPLSSGVISLSSAQLLALGDTAIEIVAAPGANKVIVPERAITTLTFGTVAYPNVTSFKLLYGSTDDPDLFYQCPIAPFNGDSNTEDSFMDVPIQPGSVAYLKAGTAGVSLTLLYSGDDDLSPGDGTGTIEVFYRIVSWS